MLAQLQQLPWHEETWYQVCVFSGEMRERSLLCLQQAMSFFISNIEVALMLYLKLMFSYKIFCSRMFITS